MQENQLNIRNLASTYCPPFLRPTFDRIDGSPLATRLARGTFWSLAGAVISRGLMLLASIFVARMLGKTGYGELGMVRSTVGMLGVFAGFGLGLTATKHVAEFRESDPERAGRIIALSTVFACLLGGIMSIGMFIFAPWLAGYTLNAPHLTGVLRIGSIILFIDALNGAQTGVLSGFEAFKIIAHVNLFTGLMSFPILVGSAYYGGLVGATWGLAGNLIINWLLNHFALCREAQRHNVPLGYQNCMSEWSILWTFSLPAFLAGSMVGPVNWFCCSLLVHQPNGYSEMGILSASNQWFAALLFLPGMLGGVVLPLLSDQIGKGETRQSAKTLFFSVKVNLLIVAPLVLVTSISSPIIMSLYGADFTEGWKTLTVVLLTAGIYAVQAPIGQIVAASGRMWLGFAMNTGWAVLFTSFTLILINHGSLGLAIARAISYFIHAIWTFGFAKWLLSNQLRS